MAALIIQRKGQTLYYPELVFLTKLMFKYRGVFEGKDLSKNITDLFITNCKSVCYSLKENQIKHTG